MTIYKQVDAKSPLEVDRCYSVEMSTTFDPEKVKGFEGVWNSSEEGGSFSLVLEKTSTGLEGITNFTDQEGRITEVILAGLMESSKSNKDDNRIYRWVFRNKCLSTDQQFLITIPVTETGQMGMGFYASVIPVDNGLLRLSIIQ
jgi:hypothetical protein